jgi:hypothetical protein
MSTHPSKRRRSRDRVDERTDSSTESFRGGLRRDSTLLYDICQRCLSWNFEVAEIMCGVERLSLTVRKSHSRRAVRVLLVKYLGDKPRGFAVLTTRPKTGRVVAGEFNSPRPFRDGSAGIDTRTLGASVRVGGSTPPDNSRRTTPKTWVLRGVAFPNCLSQRWIKVFNPSLWVSDCTHCTIRGLVNLSTAFTLGVKPRGTRPAPPVDHFEPEVQVVVFARLAILVERISVGDPHTDALALGRSCRVEQADIQHAPLRERGSVLPDCTEVYAVLATCPSISGPALRCCRSSSVV